mgnify:CR=1 FL=1
MIDKAWVDSDRNIRTLESLQALYGHGRLANTGYVSILPVDQGIEHSAGASFAPNPLYFDPGNIVKLAIEGGFDGDPDMVGLPCQICCRMIVNPVFLKTAVSQITPQYGLA